MDREILFRGKDAYTGEWVYGDFASGIILWDNWDFHSHSECYSNVIDETVGQYTGIKDKNGVKIFEGDCIGCRGNVVEYVGGTFTINGDRPLSWLKGTKDFIIVGNIHDKQ